MKEEFERILNCMCANDTVLGGEYYLVHEDHIHDFKAAIDNYLENGDKIRELYLPKLDDTTLSGLIKSLRVVNEDVSYKINQIIRKINSMEEE